ncbi:hypothetical protein SDC9_202844 [bioreactor metagenome]|uniref:Uncharacterized protein n=1 Tax=bioreactor metagenome TaxID=1076179 RepID=A0A645IUR8_9ZZZZ
MVENGKRVLLDGELANDYSVDSHAFDSDLRNLLMESNLLSVDDLTGEELIMDFSLQYTRFLTRLGALPETEMNTLCRRMTDAAAAGDDDLRSYWEDALTTTSGSMDDVQKRAYECLRSYVDSTGTGT